MNICTIVARNYVGAARVLARSFAAHNPGGTCWTLVVDDLNREITTDSEPFTVVRPEDLAIEPWSEMVAGYSVLELSTAVKPWLLKHLLRQHGVGRLTYLDPDIQVFSSLEEIDELLAEHAVVVNPHLTDPMPRDGKYPAETDILVSGSFNLGFAGFAAGDQVTALLDWWAERLATDCLVAPERGYFVDQRWMDLAPGLIPSLCILRDPGYNVAYWNLSGRDVNHAENGYSVNGVPLRFFHFSGYDPDRPAELSKHQDRISLEDRPVVRELCDGYGQALAAEGHERWRTRRYAYGALPDGTPLDAAARSVYRDAAAAGALSDPNVFSDSGARAFLAYLRGPGVHGRAQGVSRYLEALRNSRPDLREAFPDLDGPDGSRLVAWAELSAGGVPPALIGEGSAVTGPPAVNMVGYFKGVMGVGEHTRQLAAALRSQHIEVSTTNLRPVAAPEDESLADPAAFNGAVPGTGHAAYFNLLSVNADSVPAVASSLGEDFFTDRYSIGFWAWEVSAFPDRFAAAFAHLDEVWVGSRHVRDAVATHASVPVLAIPQPVSLPDGFAEAGPPAGLPAGFRFLFSFDYLSVFERKNPLAVIHAFSRAFSPGSGAVLIIKTLNDDHDPNAHQRLRAAAASHPDIHLLGQRLSTTERNGLMNASDCYVSLHRAEGFGYTLAESMWAGKPVIATGYSGNLDFMTTDNSYLVDYRIVPIGGGHDPYPPGGEWAEPNVEHAAALMREVFDHPDAAQRRGERAASEIRASHSPEVAGAVMAARLQRVLASPAWRSRRRGAGRPGPLYTEWVGDLIRSGPVPPGLRPRFGTPQRAARKGLLRLLKPVVVHESLVDRELLKAIEKVDANLQSLSLSHAAALRRIEELQGEVRRLRGDADD
jgi:glycosyltransferase involved in cell wall biosynthesis